MVLIFSSSDWHQVHLDVTVDWSTLPTARSRDDRCAVLGYLPFLNVLRIRRRRRGKAERNLGSACGRSGKRDDGARCGDCKLQRSLRIL